MADKVFLTEQTKTGAGVDFRTQVFKFIKRTGFVKESVFFFPQEDVTLMNANLSDNSLKYTRQKDLS